MGVIKAAISDNHVINMFGCDQYERERREKIAEYFVAVFTKAIDDMDPAKDTDIEHIALDQIYIGIDICNMAQLNPAILGV